MKAHGLTFAEWDARYVKRDANGKLIDLIYDPEVMEVPDALDTSASEIPAQQR